MLAKPTAGLGPLVPAGRNDATSGTRGNRTRLFAIRAHAPRLFVRATRAAPDVLATHDELPNLHDDPTRVRSAVDRSAGRSRGVISDTRARRRSRPSGCLSYPAPKVAPWALRSHLIPSDHLTKAPRLELTCAFPSLRVWWSDLALDPVNGG